MLNKTALQIFILLVIGMSIFLVFTKYFKNKTIKKVEESKTIISEDKNLDEVSNLLKDVSYSTVDFEGNKYEIFAKTGEVDVNDSNIIFMKGVKAKITLINKEEININSNLAKYNNSNYETKFSDNIYLVYLDHQIGCEFMYLNIENNFLTLYENLVYNSSKGELVADRVEIDLKTKDLKVIMDKKNKDIKIKISET